MDKYRLIVDWPRNAVPAIVGPDMSPSRQLGEKRPNRRSGSVGAGQRPAKPLPCVPRVIGFRVLRHVRQLRRLSFGITGKAILNQATWVNEPRADASEGGLNGCPFRGRYRNLGNPPIILTCPERSTVSRPSRQLPLFRLLPRTGPTVHRASPSRKHPSKLQPQGLHSFEFSWAGR